MTDDPTPAAQNDVSVSTARVPATPTVADVPLISPVNAPSSPFVRFGGLLGIVGCLLGLGILLIGCAGYSAALRAAPGAIGLGALGVVITLIGAFFQHRRIGEDTHVLQALFACLLSVIGGLLELAMHMKWAILK
jgi:hypothetical protein